MDPGTVKSLTTRFAKLLVVDTFIVEVMTELVTVRDVKVPTLVMFGWEGCETTRATFAFATLPTRLALWMFESALPWPEKKEAVTLPFTNSPVRVPTCVMLGWKG
jgi:hypothetical protein